jgi:hypothetical protein
VKKNKRPAPDRLRDRARAGLSLALDFSPVIKASGPKRESHALADIPGIPARHDAHGPNCAGPVALPFKGSKTPYTPSEVKPLRRTPYGSTTARTWWLMTCPWLRKPGTDRNHSTGRNRAHVTWTHAQSALWPLSSAHLTGSDRELAIKLITANHYTHSVPSGKSHYYGCDQAIIVFSLPANYNTSTYLLGRPGNLTWELSRLWAPDGHPPNLLTAAICEAVHAFRTDEPDVIALVSYADPNAGHHGGIYRAASWLYLGQTENRCWVDSQGKVIPRRSFHSGHSFLTKPQIQAMGYTEVNLPGKHRYAKGLTRGARRLIERRHTT